MKKPAKETARPAEPVEGDNLRGLKHDVNNQLSNILLAVEQLRYEIPNVTEDCVFYLDSITISSTKISELLKATGQ